MKKLLLLTILLFLSTNAYSAEPAKIAVVDLQKLDVSTAMVSLREQTKKEREQYEAAAIKQDDDLRKEEAKLQEQRKILTKEAFAEKSTQFKDKVAKAQRDFQEKRSAHEEEFKKSLGQINTAIYEIVTDLAKEEGFDIAISASQTFYANKKLDISDKVLERLNKKLPKVLPNVDAGKEAPKDKEIKKN